MLISIPVVAGVELDPLEVAYRQSQQLLRGNFLRYSRSLGSTISQSLSELRICPSSPCLLTAWPVVEDELLSRARLRSGGGTAG